jgi:hypothetical protein
MKIDEKRINIEVLSPGMKSKQKRRASSKHEINEEGFSEANVSL